MTTTSSPARRLSRRGKIALAVGAVVLVAVAAALAIFAVVRHRSSRPRVVSYGS